MKEYTEISLEIEAASDVVTTSKDVETDRIPFSEQEAANASSYET